MLRFGADDREIIPKCYVAHGMLPSFFDPKNLPTKKKPFSAIRAQTFNHTAELILPQAIYDEIHSELPGKLKLIQYSTMVVPLSALLERDFLNAYIKSGNIIMLSEARVGIDNSFALADGTLTLHLNRESYERAGLVGKPDGSAKTKRARARWLVEINLQAPSMVHGKKGFERIQWAFKNVLSRSVTWLFCNLNQEAGATDALACHHPVHKICSQETFRTESVLVPPLTLPVSGSQSDGIGADWEEFDDGAVDLYEWLSLVSLQSPRILASDSLDPYLSRYEVPSADTATTTTLIRIRWSGLLPSSWIADVWLKTLTAVRRSPQASFFILSVHAFESSFPNGQRSYSIMRQPQPEPECSGLVEPDPGRTAASSTADSYILWEVNSD